MQLELGNAVGVLLAGGEPEETNMPVILLWVGLPIILLGGGYFIVQSMH